ncbi:hypothetical protein BC941DRAFT_471380 [Chlamydoabsidia padenii]|nr:hypothetical protein BC941DRAFT_471380 [Chlamydoabsidia padenii]
MKRPRAPIACFRCHHKKVRCDGAHPFCTRCQSTGSSCSYPSSRRSRNTQPHHVDPYIDHLSQLEHQIQQIEVDMNNYRSMLFSTNSSGDQEDILRSHLTKTEQEVQESRTILAQLRLRGEQRIARTKRNQTKEAKQKQQQQQQQQQQRTTMNKKKPKTRKSEPDLSTFLGMNESASRSAPTELTTLHPFLSLNTSSADTSINLYGTPSSSSTSYSQQQPITSNDLYYMSEGSRSYYNPMMEYPWTTPTDFSTDPIKNEAAKEKHNNNGNLWAKTDTNDNTETAHYSPSTVAAIEEVARLAQQINSQQPQ